MVIVACEFWSCQLKDMSAFLGGQAASIISSPQKLSEFWSSNFSNWLMGSRRANPRDLRKDHQRSSNDHLIIQSCGQVISQLV